MIEEKKHTVRGILCTTIGGVCWGFSGTCGQYLFTNFEITSLWLTCMRLLVSGIMLTLVAFLTSRKEFLEVWRQPKALLQLAVYGIFGLAMCQFAYMTSISYSNAGTTTVLQNLSLLLIMLLACLRAHRFPNRREGIALVLAVLGTYILATGGNPGQMVLSHQGLFWGLMTAVAVTIYTILPRRLLPVWGREVVTGLGMLFGGIFVNLTARSWTYEVHLPMRGWLALGAIIVLGSLVAFSLFMQGVTDIGPVKSSMLAATEPVAATVFSAIWLGTRFSVTDLLGFACIVATIFLLAKSE